MKKSIVLFFLACLCLSLQAYASCETSITPSQAAAKAQASDHGSYCIEGYVVGIVLPYQKTDTYENQSFLMADTPDGDPVFAACLVEGVDHTIGIGSYVRIVDATLMMYGDLAGTHTSRFTVQIISEVPTVVNLPEYGASLTPSEAELLCLSFPYHDTPTEEMYIVEGYAQSVATIDSQNGIQTVYLADTKNGEYHFQAWECRAIKNSNNNYMLVEEGDHVFVTGHLSRYNRNAQIKDGFVARYAVEPYAARVSADPGKGYATISGSTEFTLLDMADVQITMTAVPDPGYEFVMWIDPSRIDLSDPEAEMKAAQPVLDIYNRTKGMTEDDLRTYAEQENVGFEELMAVLSMVDKMVQPTMVFDIDDLTFWKQINEMPDDTHVFLFRAVFRETDKEGMESIQPAAVSAQKLLRNGQLLILRNGRTYTPTGAER